MRPPIYDVWIFRVHLRLLVIWYRPVDLPYSILPFANLCRNAIAPVTRYVINVMHYSWPAILWPVGMSACDAAVSILILLLPFDSVPLPSGHSPGTATFWWTLPRLIATAVVIRWHSISCSTIPSYDLPPATTVTRQTGTDDPCYSRYSFDVRRDLSLMAAWLDSVLFVVRYPTFMTLIFCPFEIPWAYVTAEMLSCASTPTCLAICDAYTVILLFLLWWPIFSIVEYTWWRYLKHFVSQTFFYSCRLFCNAIRDCLYRDNQWLSDFVLFCHILLCRCHDSANDKYSDHTTVMLT